MNRYSRVFHHISVEDVKRNGYKKYKKNENFLESIRNARKFLRDMNSPNYSDWRCNKLKEGMNTDNVFVTTFPSTGDSNLENIDANNANVYTAAGGLDALNGTSIKSNGSGSGQSGGFNVGQSYLSFDGTADSRHAILDPIDSSKFDTMSIRAIVGNDSNGGEDPDVPGEELRLYYLEPNGSSFKSIAINPAGDQVLSADSDVIIALGDGLDGALQNFSVSLPSYARGEGFTYMLYQLSNSGAQFDHYGITNIKYQRRSPVSLVVSLDSPEAVAFIRDGGNLTPAEKKKRLEDMLAASDEYMDTMFPTNQEAMRRAEQNLQRNIDISLDPDTFKFPEDPATWNELFPRSLTDSPSAQQIDRYMETKGLTFDTLTKDAIQKNMDGSAQINVINTVDVENRDKFLTALGYNVNSLNSLSNDTYRKLSDAKLYLRPGGTPSTGWNGKMYDILDDSIEYEKSKIVPLDTYLKAKAEPDWYGVEKPDVAPPGSRYVMEKKYGFQSDDKAVVEFTGPQNETFKQRSKDAEYNIRRVGSYGSLGFSWALTHFERGLGGGLEAGSNFARKGVVNAMTTVLNHMYRSRDSLAFAYAIDRKVDTTAQYDPLYHLLKYDDGRRALEIASNTSARQLDYPYPSSGGGAPAADGWWHADVAENDRSVANFKKAYDRIKSMSTDFASYDNDSWYVKDRGATGGQSDVTVGAPSKAHPYANVNMTQPTDPTSPDDPFMDIQVGDERIVKRGDETVLDTMKGIDDKQKTDPTQPDPTGPLGIDDFGSVADFSAYKAGGGDAAVKSGKTVEDVIAQGNKNLDAFNGGSPQPSDPDNQKLSDEITNIKNNKVKDPAKETPNLLIRLVKLITGADDSVLADANKIAGETIAPVVDAASKIEVGGISVSDAIPPLYKYGGDIAVSMLSGEPVIRTKDDLSSNDIDLFLKNSNLDRVKITKTPVPYADDHIRELPDGTVVINKTGENNTIPIFDPPIVKVQRPFSDVLGLPAGAPVAADLGFSNPIGAAGQAQVQIIVPDNNPQNAYLKYTDHAYYNDDSDDPGEAAGKDALADAVNSIAPGLGPGYKSNMKGDRILKFDVPYNDLLPKQQKLVDDEIADRELGKGSLGDTLRNIGATDTATVSADNKRKKKTNAVAEMYEPKAKHNEKIAKRMKSPKEFFKQADIKPVYPKDPPPEMINGYHPDLIDGEKVSNRFNKLDPQSAKAMPATGNPNIDKKVGAAAKKPK